MPELCVDEKSSLQQVKPLPAMADAGAFSACITAFAALLGNELRSVESIAKSQTALAQSLKDEQQYYDAIINDPIKGSKPEDVMEAVQDRAEKTTVAGNITATTQNGFKAAQNQGQRTLTAVMTGAKMAQKEITAYDEFIRTKV